MQGRMLVAEDSVEVENKRVRETAEQVLPAVLRDEKIFETGGVSKLLGTMRKDAYSRSQAAYAPRKFSQRSLRQKANLSEGFQRPRPTPLRNANTSAASCAHQHRVAQVTSIRHLLGTALQCQALDAKQQNTQPRSAGT